MFVFTKKINIFVTFIIVKIIMHVIFNKKVLYNRILFQGIYVRILFSRFYSIDNFWIINKYKKYDNVYSLFRIKKGCCIYIKTKKIKCIICYTISCLQNIYSLR